MSNHYDTWDEIKETLTKILNDIKNHNSSINIAVCLNIHNNEKKIPISKLDRINK